MLTGLIIIIHTPNLLLNGTPYFQTKRISVFNFLRANWVRIIEIPCKVRQKFECEVVAINGKTARESFDHHQLLKFNGSTHFIFFSPKFLLNTPIVENPDLVLGQGEGFFLRVPGHCGLG